MPNFYMNNNCSELLSHHCEERLLGRCTHWLLLLCRLRSNTKRIVQKINHTICSERTVRLAVGLKFEKRDFKRIVQNSVLPTIIFYLVNSAENKVSTYTLRED